VAELVPYARNSRTHSEAQVAQIAASISEWGFTNPILIDPDGGIIAGHGRLLAAQRLGLTEVPCITATGWTDAQKRAYVIADNRLALNAGWDTEMLAIEFADLSEGGFDLGLTGFDPDEISALLADPIEEGLTDEDEVPDAPTIPVSASGDVWLLGAHRVMCGSATIQTDVERLMAGVKADMVFTDPPYNTGMSAKKNAGSTRLSHMFEDSYTDDEWQEFMAGFCASYDIATKQDSFIFVCLDWRRSHELVPHLKRHWHFSNLIVWDKMVHGLGSDYKYSHEFIHVCKNGKPPLATNKDGDAEYQDVWHIQRKVGRDDDHATKKPIELCERAIRHTSVLGDIVLDLFGGSGSTLIACQKTGRSCRMMELDPKYVDVIIKRWQDFTGHTATLDGDGRTFAEVSNER
jgi:DNA modification methylase